jgi:MT-A70
LNQHPETASVRVRGGPGRHKKNESQNATGKVPAFIDDTASKTGKHRATIAREVARGKIVRLAEVIGTTLDCADELDALVKLPAIVQHDLIGRAKAGERVTAKHVAQKLRRECRERKLASATKAASEALGQELYGVIYADPPWKFVVRAETGLDHCADGHYPCMSIDQIKRLPIPAADDCVLFLWGTVPMLPQVLAVMEAWGFTYKSLMTWIKDREGTGYWIRNRVELLLIGTRGNVPAPRDHRAPLSERSQAGNVCSRGAARLGCLGQRSASQSHHPRFPTTHPAGRQLSGLHKCSMYSVALAVRSRTAFALAPRTPSRIKKLPRKMLAGDIATCGAIAESLSEKTGAASSHLRLGDFRGGEIPNGKPS